MRIEIKMRHVLYAQIYTHKKDGIDKNFCEGQKKRLTGGYDH